MAISRRGLTLPVALFLWLSVPTANGSISSAATPIYTYRDDSGAQNFTTELDSIPEEFRDRAVPLDLEPSSASPPIVSGEPSAPSATVRVLTAGGEYRMGDHDTRADAVRLAVEAAKKEALEQIATYLESVTEIKDMDVTRDEVRTYTAGIVTVLDQKITTRLEGETVVIRADLTAQVDPGEVAQAITALRENESAKNELAALRLETDQLRQQLYTANQAMAAALSPEQVQALNQERQDLLNQLQANAFVSQAWTDWVYMTPVIYPYPWLGLQQVQGLLLQAQRLHPRNGHLPIVQRFITTQAGTLPPAQPGVPSPVQPHPSLLVPPPAPLRVTPPRPQTLLPGSANAATSPNASRAPAPVPPRQFSSPLTPRLHQVPPPNVAQSNPPVLRAPYSVPHHSPSMSPRYFGGGGRHFGGGGHFGGGHRGR